MQRRGKVAYDGVWMRAGGSQAGHIAETFERVHAVFDHLGVSTDWLAALSAGRVGATGRIARCWRCTPSLTGSLRGRSLLRTVWTGQIGPADPLHRALSHNVEENSETACRCQCSRQSNSARCAPGERRTARVGCRGSPLGQLLPTVHGSTRRRPQTSQHLIRICRPPTLATHPAAPERQPRVGGGVRREEEHPGMRLAVAVMRDRFRGEAAIGSDRWRRCRPSS